MGGCGESLILAAEFVKNAVLHVKSRFPGVANAGDPWERPSTVWWPTDHGEESAMESRISREVL